MMEIVSHVPIPQPKWHEVGYTATIRKLQSGQSVLLPCDPRSTRTLARRIFFKSDYVVEKEGRGTRIWRK